MAVSSSALAFGHPVVIRHCDRGYTVGVRVRVRVVVRFRVRVTVRTNTTLADKGRGRDRVSAMVAMSAQSDRCTRSDRCNHGGGGVLVVVSVLVEVDVLGAVGERV